MAKPARLQILERARTLIKDERHWCSGDLARDAQGLSISPTDRNTEKRCALGALLAAAHQLTGDFNSAQEVEFLGFDDLGNLSGFAPQFWVRTAHVFYDRRN